MKSVTNTEQEKFVGAFLREDPANPDLARLRKDYELDAVIAPGKDELDRLLHLQDWVYSRFDMFGRPTVQTENALEILEKAAAGHTFYCAHYAILMVAAATALGWDARPVSVRRADESYRGSNHNVAEIWVGRLGKWVMFDATQKFIAVARGVPLNCYELAREWFNHEGRNLEIHVGADRVRYTRDHLPIHFKYYDGYGNVEISERSFSCLACLAYIPTNRLLGQFPERSIEHWDDWNDLLIIFGAERQWQDEVTELPPYYPSARLQ